MSRPTEFTPEFAAEICTQIAEGKSLRKLCAQPDFPSKTTILRWLSQQPEFQTQYAHAREMQADHYADEVVDIADEKDGDYGFKEDSDKDGDGAKPVFLAENVQRSKLRIEARKWHASKLQPKKYGDYQRIDAQVNVSIADRLKEARERAKNR